MSLSVLQKFDGAALHDTHADLLREKLNCVDTLSSCQPWQALINTWLFRYRNLMRNIFIFALVHSESA